MSKGLSSKSAEKTIASGAVNGFVLTDRADVRSWANGEPIPEEADVRIWSDATFSITAAILYAGRLEDGVINDDDVDTVDFANNELDIATHGLETGDGPIQLTTTDTLPAGLSLSTDYWVIRVDAGTIQLAASLDDALDGTAVAFTDGGTGTHTIEDTASTKKVKWFLVDELGKDADGAIDLTARLAYQKRVSHVPGTLFYALVATFTGTANASIQQVMGF